MDALAYAAPKGGGQMVSCPYVCPRPGQALEFVEGQIAGETVAAIERRIKERDGLGRVR